MTQIITPQELKDSCLIDINVLDSNCLPGIKHSQELNLRKLIGESLYNAIITKIDSNTLTGKYKTLVDDYIKDYLYLDAAAEIQPLIASKIRNAGVVVTNEENFKSAEDDSIDRKVKYYKTRADAYGLLVINYIRKNSADFPEFHTEDCNEIKPQDSSFRLNIF